MVEPLQPGDWPAPVADGPLDAVVQLPGSKSLTNRYLVLAALAVEQSVLRSPLRSRDTELMAAGLRALGTGVGDGPRPVEAGDVPDWLVTPGPVRGPARVDCGLAGTVMRFLPPVAALADGPVDFDGDPAARVRPMGPVLDALRALGAQVDDGGRGTLPFRVTGPGCTAGGRSGRTVGGLAGGLVGGLAEGMVGGMAGGRVTLDASRSSQFVSALLLAGARYRHGVTVRHEGPPLPSAPHLRMTVETLRDAGVVVDDQIPDVWRVEPGPVAGLDVDVEPDLSNAAPFLGAALVAGGRVRVPGWPQRTTQGGDALRDILDAMGARVVLDRTGLTVTGDGTVTGVDLDLGDTSELAPTVAALAALADGPSRIRGVAHIRGHETDRLAALAAELAALGARVEQTADGLQITPRPLRGIRFRTYADHRLATAAALVGLRVPGVVVEDVATTGKTLPGFTALWAGMLAGAAR